MWVNTATINVHWYVDIYYYSLCGLYFIIIAVVYNVQNVLSKYLPKYCVSKHHGDYVFTDEIVVQTCAVIDNY